MSVILADCLDDTVSDLAHFFPPAEGLREKRVYNERPPAGKRSDGGLSRVIPDHLMYERPQVPYGINDSRVLWAAGAIVCV
jgi:hypothetical protein